MSGKRRRSAQNLPSKSHANDASKDHANNPENDANGQGQVLTDSRTLKDIHPENPELIRELRERYTLTRAQAKRAIAKGLGWSNRDAYRVSGAKCSTDQSLDANASAAISNHKVQSAADDVFSQHFQQLKDQGFTLDEDRILADLELFKKKAVENQQLSAGVKATELQGRAIGVEFTHHQKTEQIQQLSDSDVLKAIAGENPALARELRQAMAIEGEYEQVGKNKPSKSDT